MAFTVSDFMIQRLSQWGVRRIFGYPGDGINGVMGALERTDTDIQFVQVRHEEMAAFMACAHAKYTGEVGICLATSGPGAIHLLNGLYDARMDNQPVVAIVGQSARYALGSYFQQEVDLISLFKDVAGNYVHMMTDPEQARHLIDLSVRIAKAERTVTCLIVPADVQILPAVTMPQRKHGRTFSGIGYSEPVVIPKEEDLARAAQILNDGEKVAMLIGAGAMGACDEVMETANILGAGVAKALLGKAVLGDDLPYVTGSIGLLGTEPSYSMMKSCDTFLMVGSSFPYAEFLPAPGQARGVQIDWRGRMLSLRYPMDVNLVGDAKATLRALIPLLKPKGHTGWRDKIEHDVRDWWELMNRRAQNPANPINPQQVFVDLSARLPENCIISSDVGSATFWFARDLKIRRGMMASVSGRLATMGCAMPYAIAGKFGFPDRPALALVGDGAMQMNGGAELITVAKYWKQWENPQFIVLVLDNRDLNFVSWEMRVMMGNPKYEASQGLPGISYAEFAEDMGLKGIHMENPDEVAVGIEAALTADRPVVLEVKVDPDVPPLPPHITLEQAKHFAESMLKGDPDAMGIAKASFRDLFAGIMLPGR